MKVKAPEHRVIELDNNPRPDGTREYAVEELMSECRGFAPVDANDRQVEVIVGLIGTVDTAQMLSDCENILDSYGVECPHDDRPEPLTSMLLVVKCQSTFGIYSQPWYAARCLLFQQLAKFDEMRDAACVNFGSSWQQMVHKSRYEKYARAGLAAEENREKGRALATDQRRRDGRVRRRAIADAARKLISQEPDLYRNRTELARRIAALELPQLEKPHGGQIRVDAIRKQLKPILESGQFGKIRFQDS